MVIFATSIEEAKKAVEQGAIAVEAAFGSESVVNDPSEPFDHHNRFSTLPCATMQAFNSSKHAKDVVVNHVDLDCAMASALLLGEVSRSNEWIKKMIPLIEITDRQGIQALTAEQKNLPEYQLVLYFFQRNFGASSAAKVNDAIQILKTFEKGPNNETQKSLQREEERKEKAKQGIIKQEGSTLLVNSPVWGFDEWYKTAPVVVAFDPNKNSISLSVKDTATAEKFFGKGGLKTIFPQLGADWGGRESVGGSPRGKTMTMDDAEKTYEILKKNIRVKQAKKTPHNRTEKVFVYKTLKNKNTYRALGDFMSHEITKAENATLSGYQDLNKGTGYHTIVKKPGSTVKGKVLNVKHADLVILDQWEDKYKRVRVTLDDGTHAWTYKLKVHKIVEAFMRAIL
jgi:gamma-glutamylcyclotransferase (GGCT)/AIG2-like uncharacterized protein YtfP